MPLSKASNSMSKPNAHQQACKSVRTPFFGVAVAITVCLLIIGCVTEDDLTTDQRVHQLSQQLMCPVCDGQTLDQSQAQLSEDMKAVIRTKIEEDETNAEIREYFVDRYGEIVLASPDTGGFNLIAWVMPVVIFLGGALLVGNAYLNMRRRKDGDGLDETADRAETPVTESTGRELNEYLKRADREMTSALGKSPSTPDLVDEKRDVD